MDQLIREHWNKIYTEKQPHEVSWTQAVPQISLDLIHAHAIPKGARIIDVGGGDSTLVDHLLAEGYTDITVLDISQASIDRAKERLGKDADRVRWIVTDILDFQPEEPFDLWHDRAAFHFQTSPEAIDAYMKILQRAVRGMVIIGTFSTEGPSKCSGLEVKQYNEGSMKALLEQAGFRNTECRREDHLTPSGSVQNFIFCGFETHFNHTKKHYGHS
jgi:ubiquinone/menaquinone biosynthesis C-methylase UbiE